MKSTKISRHFLNLELNKSTRLVSFYTDLCITTAVYEKTKYFIIVCFVNKDMRRTIEKLILRLILSQDTIFFKEKTQQGGTIPNFLLKFSR